MVSALCDGCHWRADVVDGAWHAQSDAGHQQGWETDFVVARYERLKRILHCGREPHGPDQRTRRAPGRWRDPTDGPCARRIEGAAHAKYFQSRVTDMAARSCFWQGYPHCARQRRSVVRGAEVREGRSQRGCDLEQE